MPIPKPDEGQSQDDFIQMCMSNNTMGEDYPDNEQRLAICFQSWRDRNKKEVNNLDQIKKVFNFDVKQIGLDDERMLGFTGSTESEDRDGDIIEAFGWDLTDYQKNPVIMGFHEYDKFPYAKSTKTYIDYNAKQLKFEVKFPTISELTSFPGSPDMIAEHAKNVDMAYNMYKNGYMSAVSVGFIGMDHEPMQDEQGNYKGRRYKKQSLLELSLVPVPSNSTALMEARSKGLISDKELKQLEIKDELDKNEKPPEQKAGATISAKNRQMMEEAMGHMEMAMGMMREMMASRPEEEAQMPMEPIKSAMRTVNNEELKSALDEIKSQVLLLSQKSDIKVIAQEICGLQKSASRVIDLDAIEYIPLQKDAAKDELNIEPEVLKNMIKEIISNNLQGGIQ